MRKEPEDDYGFEWIRVKGMDIKMIPAWWLWWIIPATALVAVMFYFVWVVLVPSCFYMC